MTRSAHLDPSPTFSEETAAQNFADIVEIWGATYYREANTIAAQVRLNTRATMESHHATYLTRPKLTMLITMLLNVPRTLLEIEQTKTAAQRTAHNVVVKAAIYSPEESMNAAPANLCTRALMVLHHVS
jgi:hypothetical protein